MNVSTSLARTARRAFLGRALLAFLVASPLAACGVDAASLEPFHGRVAVIGASASAGYNLNVEAGREVKLGDLLEAAAPGAFAEVLDASDLSLFLQPEQRLARKIEEVVAFGPDVVVGVDAMFWFGYGPTSDDARVEKLRRGLELLDGMLARTGAVLALGDLPDVRDANPIMLPRSYRPSDAVLAALNEELRAWCDARSDVVVVPLARFTDDVRRGRAVRVFDTVIADRPISTWQQSDRLHPTLEGTAAMALIALQALERTVSLRDTVRSDPAVVADAVRARE